MSVRMLSRPPSTNSNASNAGIQVSLSPPLSIINTTSSSPPSFTPSSSSGSPPSPSPFSFPPAPDLPFQQQRSSLSSPPPSPAAGSSVLNFSPPVHSSSSSPSISVASSTSGATCGAASPLPSSGTSGVVVVGVIGRVEHEVAQLLDRLLDAQVFSIKHGGLELCSESKVSGFVHSSGIKSRENEPWKDAAPQVASHRPSNTDIRGDSTSGLERRLEDASVGAPRFLDEKHEPASTRGLKGEKLQTGSGDNGRYKEKRLDEKYVKGLVGNGNSERRKESQLQDQSGGDDEVKGGEALRDACKSSPMLLSKLKHYHDEEKGMIYVQFTWGSLPLDILRGESFRASVAAHGLSGILEQHEADCMRGLLFMFSVCHVILLVQDGAHFDPRFLRMLRVLQAAKHSLAPFVKTQVLPGLLPPPSSLSRPSALKPISLATTNASSGRTGVVGRNSSTIALMSGSTPVLFPGQCTPVVLFVCFEDLAELPVGGISCSNAARTEDISEASTSTVSQSGPLSQSVATNYMSRQSTHTKPAAMTVIRTNNKSEAGFRKKLQSSMEAQIRFLLKKCRTVVGSGESGTSGVGGGPGMGPRGPGGSANSFQGVGGGSLFVLDPSRAVVLLDRSSNRLTDALDAATDAIEAMLLGREGADDGLWEVGINAGVAGEDIQAVKDFLWRQADILRGKGGISSNAAGGSAGVGMVAAAAAAAAASAASGGSSGTNKPICSPPELPTISSWLSACRVLAEALSIRATEEVGVSTGQRTSEGNRSVMKKGSMLTRISVGTGTVVRSKGTIDATISCLESGANMDQKFSAAWCKRVLPSAHEVYMKGLPPCYPTSLHKSQLEKALSVFRTMVRGPAVPVYAEKLIRDCEAVWQSGRQLCDAESLTGKPCIHQVHEVNDSVSANSNVARRKVKYDQDTVRSASEKRIVKPHSSGIMFLHACACGRSRKLRKDPFDFESANVSFFKFPNCEDLLPSLVIPNPEGYTPCGGSPWSLVCLGNSRYYQPSTGLLQGGFCSKQNFLSPWDIPIVYRKAEVYEEFLPQSPAKEQVAESLPVASGKTAVDGKIMIKSLLPRAQPVTEPKTAAVNLYSKVAEKGYLDSSRANATRGTGVPGTPKGFTDIATKVNYGGESAFPPLPQKQDKPAAPPAKATKHSGSKEKKDTSHIVREENLKASVSEVADKVNDRVDTTAAFEEETESNGKEHSELISKLSLNSVTTHARVYIGFEHECPHGHRFLLSADQSEDSSSSMSTVLQEAAKQESANPGRSSKSKKTDRSDVPHNDSFQPTRTQDVQSSPQQELNAKTSGPVSLFTSKWGRKEMKIPEDMQYWSVQGGHGDGRSILNSNLPIYLNCPYCKTSEDSTKTITPKGTVLGGTISQLQRIFLVTPSLPLLLATCPVVKFEDISKPVKTMMEFSPGSEVVLPPDSFLSLRLPFVYYSQTDGVPTKSLLVKQHKPEHTAWLVKGTALYVKSKEGVNGSVDG